MRIALTNLGKYNEGSLVYEWLELPYTDEELQETLNKIGINAQYEEYFISDYEAPFSISEYESLSKLNEMAEILENCPSYNSLKNDYGRYEVENILSFASEIESETTIDTSHFVGNIIRDETVNEMVYNMAQNGEDWTRIACFLDNADRTNKEYHWFNGCGNIDRITDERLERIAEDLFREVKEYVK